MFIPIIFKKKIFRSWQSTEWTNAKVDARFLEHQGLQTDGFLSGIQGQYPSISEPLAAPPPAVANWSITGWCVIYVYVSVYVCIYIYMCVCVCVRVCAGKYIYIYMCVCIYTYIHL